MDRDYYRYIIADDVYVYMQAEIPYMYTCRQRFRVVGKKRGKEVVREREMRSYNYYKMFGCFNRKFKISESEPPPDVREAFWRFTAGAQQMTAEQLLKFMVQHQEDYNFSPPWTCRISCTG